MKVNFMYENHECYILLDDTFIGHIEFEWRHSRELRHVTFYELAKLGLSGHKETYHEAIQGTNFKKLMDDIKERAELVVKAQVINSFKEDFKKAFIERDEIKKEGMDLFKRRHDWKTEDKLRYNELIRLEMDSYDKVEKMYKEERIAIKEACKDIEYNWNWIWY